MNRFYQLLPSTLAALAFVLTFSELAQPQIAPVGTVRVRSYRVWYASQWQVVRFPSVEQAVAYRDQLNRGPAGGAYEAKLADYHMAPDGSIKAGTGPNTEVYVRQWLNRGTISDANNAFRELITLKRDPSRLETRVQLDYDLRTDDATVVTGGWVTRSAVLPPLPDQFQQWETSPNTVKGNWTVDSTGQLRGEWENGAAALLRLEHWDETQVVFTREDVWSTPMEGLKARYVGKFVQGGIITGQVTYTWRGRTWQGTWNASAGSWNLAKPQVSGTCSRGQGVLVAKGNAIGVGGNALTYTDPTTRATNTIRWNEPPPSVKSGEDLTLMSWSTHNREPRIEVHWQHGNLIARGADSAVDTGGSEKSTFKQFRGGTLQLVGGIKGHLRPTDLGYFQIRWDYACQ